MDDKKLEIKVNQLSATPSQKQSTNFLLPPSQQKFKIAKSKIKKIKIITDQSKL